MADPQLPSFEIFNGCDPIEGPRTFSLSPLSLKAGVDFPINLLLELERKRISQIQGVYIDNSENTGTLTLRVVVTNQSLIVQPGFQAFFPVLSPNPPSFVITSSADATIGLQLFNFPVQPMQWGAETVNTFSLDASNGIALNPNPFTGGNATIEIDGAPAGAFYASGNFTPVLSGSVTPGNQTYSFQQGNWVRIGNMIFFNLNIRLTALDAAAAGNATIALPFNSANVANEQAQFTAVFNNITLSAGQTQVVGELSPNTNVLLVAAQGSGAGLNAAIPITSFANNAVIRMSGAYMIA